MPVVEKSSDLIADVLAGDIVPDPARARGRPIVATGTVENADDDSADSTYHLADLPSDCILDSRTALQVENWGFAAVRVGTRSDVDALVSVAKSGGNVVTPIVFGDSAHGLPLWQVLGLGADPGGTIGLYAHAIAGATGAGSMKFELHYRYR